MGRTPPIDVRRQLRAEVGFGCPVEECGNPYLSYHHFDPPWSERQHHEAAGMIALCGEHHPKADSGSFTFEQLRELKKRKADNVQGSFNWRRNEVLALVGGGAYLEVPTIFEYHDSRVIWFDRDEQDLLLLSIRMPTTEPTLEMERNDWTLLGKPDEFESPPSGKRISVRYPTGDRLSVEFGVLESPGTLMENFPIVPASFWATIGFPLTTVKVGMVLPELGIEFGPTSTEMPGIHAQGNFVAYSGGGFSIS